MNNWVCQPITAAERETMGESAALESRRGDFYHLDRLCIQDSRQQARLFAHRRRMRRYQNLAHRLGAPV